MNNIHKHKKIFWMFVVVNKQMCELFKNCFTLEEINKSIGDDQDKKYRRMSGKFVYVRLLLLFLTRSGRIFNCSDV